jgi:hypothetical protein
MNESAENTRESFLGRPSARKAFNVSRNQNEYGVIRNNKRTIETFANRNAARSFARINGGVLVKIETTLLEDFGVKNS